ncbi:MAG: serine hydrolase [Lachnospiraceae bacterium]|nr:serine hydrolase [Lachnospiraceae bacterium]
MNINRHFKKSIALFLALLTLFFLSACASEEIPLPYGTLQANDNFSIEANEAQTQIPLFASDLCATANDITDDSTAVVDGLNAACIYDINQQEVLYSYQANERLNPASLTKVMTALLVMENCNMDDVVLVGDVTIYEDGVQLFNLKTGDRITVQNLLYTMLVYSANDAALALAQHVAGSEEAFVEMMNTRALQLGATNTHFVNPHGLSHEEHYTTAYDLYLIFNAAAEYDIFQQIINTTSYTVEYTLADGTPSRRDITTTNKFLSEIYDSPAGISIVGGKTGSTMAAGKCIIVYATDAAMNPYICVVMGAGNEEQLYHLMKQLCEDVILR